MPIKLAPNVLLQEVADEMVILNPADGQYYGLNEVGARIVQLLQEGKDIPSLKRCLLNEFDVEPDRLERDIHALIEDLRRHALIQNTA